jgi:hypothetical protein
MELFQAVQPLTEQEHFTDVSFGPWAISPPAFARTARGRGQSVGFFLNLRRDQRKI